MSGEYKISTIKQIAELDERQQNDFLIDLAEWLRFNNAAKELLPWLRPNTEYIYWIDDGDAGKIRRVTLEVNDGMATD